FFSSSPLDTPHSPLFSLDHLVRSRQDAGWNRQAKLLSGFQIDDQFELSRLLDRKVGRFPSLEDLVNVGGGAPEQVRKTHSVKHQTTCVDKLAVWIDSWQPVLRREVHDPLLINVNDGNLCCSESLGAFL